MGMACYFFFFTCPILGWKSSCWLLQLWHVQSWIRNTFIAVWPRGRSNSLTHRHVTYYDLSFCVQLVEAPFRPLFPPPTLSGQMRRKRCTHGCAFVLHGAAKQSMCLLVALRLRADSHVSRPNHGKQSQEDGLDLHKITRGDAVVVRTKQPISHWYRSVLDVQYSHTVRG